MVFICAMARAAFADDITRDKAITAAAAASAALLQAETAINAARDAGNVWLATPGRLAEARVAAARGAFTHAIVSAERARREALLALNQSRLERARYVLDTDTDLDPDARRAARELLSTYEGAAALRVLEQAGSGP
ncbi:MAG: hypothetical protein ACU85U_03710 [Gammaproteobacteria bacterium]|jgi:hypothetical protein